MTITFLFDRRALINKKEDYISESLVKKIIENGFEVSTFYSPDHFSSQDYQDYTTSYTKFKFDLTIPEQEKDLVERMAKEWIDDLQIPKPRTEYGLKIHIKDQNTFDLIKEEINKVVKMEKSTGRLNRSNNIIYLDIYNYSKFKEVQNKLIHQKGNLGINNIEPKNTKKLIGKIEKTQINEGEVNLFLQHKDYERVISDLKEFIANVCELLSASQSQSIESLDSTSEER